MNSIIKEILNNLNIENIQTSFKFSLIITPILSFLAPIGAFFYPLIFIAALDVITGIIKNRVYHNKPFSSFELIKRKPLIFLLFSIGILTMLTADIFLKEIGITGNWAIKTYCVFYGLYEVISILENISEMGLPGSQGILKLLKGRIPNEINQALESDKKGEK